MKKVYFLLNATTLLLLNHAAWGMEKQENKNKVIVPKGKYHDGTKSWFGSGLNTLDHLGENF